MENSTQTPAPVTPVELLKRQLSDWKTLRAELLEQHQLDRSDELAEQITYCEDKIDSLTSELRKLA
ncbi:hypothetical protein [Spirosoma spitsbergense]|uniref:hypothetical protein n=1 Tax=Spirosoma spitsbergense TaxID=431554 RepID=UPI0003620AF3|nr:hypothetical protein [Spirosoma spitsbergense]